MKSLRLQPARPPPAQAQAQAHAQEWPPPELDPLFTIFGGSIVSPLRLMP